MLRTCTLCSAALDLKLESPVDLSLDYYTATCPCGAEYQFFFNKFSKIWSVKAVTAPRATTPVLIRWEDITMPEAVELVSLRADSALLGLEVFDPVAGAYDYHLTITRSPAQPKESQ